MATELTGYAGLQEASVDAKSAIQDFLKLEYTPGLINEFNQREALINRLAKDTITGKKKYKSFALGITDNVRGLGGLGIASDMYQIGLGDFIKGGDKVDAEFDTTKMIGVFSITDETIMKGTTDGSLYDTLKDTLDRMNVGLKHTQSRWTYGSHTGLVAVIKTATKFNTTGSDGDTAPGVTHPAVQVGSKELTGLWKITMSNQYLLLPGMGIMLKSKDATHQIEAVTTGAQIPYATGRIWQEDTSTLNSKTFIVQLTGYNDAVINVIEAGVEVFAAQIMPGTTGTVAQEYHGLHDILIDNSTKIFGVDRSIYVQLKNPKKDLSNEILTEEILRDMADHLELTMPEDRKIGLVCAPHRVISAVEKSLLQFKSYEINQDPTKGFNLGKPVIQFDNYQLYKDKYAHDNTVYMLDTGAVGELLRKEFGWLTSGREGILERRDGTEIYEAIMTKYADMYIETWKSHAAFVNVAEDVTP